MKNLTKCLTSYLTILIFFVITACSQDKKMTETTTTQCPKKLEIPLGANDVQPIALNTQPVIQSGIATNDKLLGYSFEAKSGQKLSYTTNQNICIWIYTPENQILSSSELPVTGKYTIQISTPKGSTTFTLTISLENATVATTPSSSPMSEPVSTEVTPSSFSSSSNPEPSVSNNDFTNSVSAPTSISNETPTPSVSLNVDRPSPEKIIEAYYSNINNHQYQDAWNILPTSFQENKQIHPDGYNSFLQWWYKVNYVGIKKSSLVEFNSYSAIVNVWTNYHMNNGKSFPIRLKYYMTWNDTKQNWDITQVDKF